MKSHTEVQGQKDKGLDKNTRQALNGLQKALRELYDEKVPRMLVYGSTARHQATDASDIDVLLIYSYKVEPAREINRISAALADLNLRYQVLIAILPANEDEYQNAPGLFWSNVRREGVPVETI